METYRLRGISDTVKVLQMTALESSGSPKRFYSREPRDSSISTTAWRPWVMARSSGVC